MKAISLRWRLTLVTVLVLTVICAANTFYSIVSAREMLMPVSFDLQTIGDKAKNVTSLTEAWVVRDYGILAEDHPDATLIGGNEYMMIVATDDAAANTRDDTVPEDGIAIEEMTDADSTGIAMSAVYAGGILTDQVETAFVTISTVQRSFNYSSLIFMGLMVLLGGVLVYLASGYALRPVKVLSRDIKAIGEEQLSHRVAPGTGAEEINRLADSFNVMLERLEKSFSAQKRFSAAAAHELKTPLAAIRANIDVLDMEAVPSQEDYLEALDVVKRQTQRMSRLVDDLFAMSSLQEWDLSEAISVDAVIQSTVQELTAAAAEKGLSIRVDAGGGRARGNQVMLSRALANLVENAIRYNVPGGAIDLHSRIEEERLLVFVSDTGPGIDPEHLPNIFDPFYRADPSRSRRLGGTGLGLAIAAEVISLHGGQVEAGNRPGGGAVFTITLPLSQED